MSPHKYPICSGKKLIKALEKIGYEIQSQKGSHVKLVKDYGSEQHIIVVPLHKELDRGTLGSIIKRVKKYYSEEKFLSILKEVD
jgi:predicted RNA binding protein YcfA (HicA-like mRNA interferase family)